MSATKNLVSTVADSRVKFYNSGWSSQLGVFGKKDSQKYIIPSDGMYILWMNSNTAKDGESMNIGLVINDDNVVNLATASVQHAWTGIKIIVPLKANSVILFQGFNLYSFGVGELTVT